MQIDFSNKVVVICGPTASGKSAIALEIARNSHKKAVIINADSMQVYKEFPKLTAIPAREERGGVKHALYEIINVAEKFSVAKWLDLALKEIAQAELPIIVGGTGMYINALIKGLAYIPEVSNKVMEELEGRTSDEIHAALQQVDPKAASVLRDRRRMIRALGVFQATGKPISLWQQDTKPLYPREKFFVIKTELARDELYKRCDERFLKMLESGAIEEVAEFIKHHKERPKILGLPQIARYLEGQHSREEMVKVAQQTVRNYAKRQMTWFRNQLQADKIISS